MALNRVAAVSTACYCGISTSIQQHNEGCLNHRKFRVELDSSSTSGSSFSSNIVRLRGCLDKEDGVFRRKHDELHKSHRVSHYRQLVRDNNVSYLGADMVNGQGSFERGWPEGFPRNRLPEKINVAVDVDEVLGIFVSALNKFIAGHYHSTHTLSEYHVYEFFKVWNCSRAEANIRVHEFFKTLYFQKGVHPIPGARQVLNKLSPFCNLSVVTSRQDVIKDHTLEWIKRHFPGLFQEIHFGNHFALDGQSRPKSEICRSSVTLYYYDVATIVRRCRSLGAHVLIDDNPQYALECAEAGIRVLLFDYDNSYPWSKSDLAISHPLVKKVHNWEEVCWQMVLPTESVNLFPESIENLKCCNSSFILFLQESSRRQDSCDHYLA